MTETSVTTQPDDNAAEALRSAVRNAYGAVADSSLSSEHAGARAVAEAFGYSADELAAIPADANMGLSCGNPTATANLRTGETVLDLGCGGGLDVFLAARQVGPEGRAIGIDMTEEMLERARRNAEQAGLENVEFRRGEIENLPVEDVTVDCVISNCVINLVPDKSRAMAEIFRVLKPGGRVAISDIALKQTLPEELAGAVEAYIGCVAGAVSVAENERLLHEAGFEQVLVVDDGADLNAYAELDGQAGCCGPAMDQPATSSCCGPSSNELTAQIDKSVHDGLADLIAQQDLNQYALSAKIYAIKPL